jgi:hypothetical protein
LRSTMQFKVNNNNTASTMQGDCVAAVGKFKVNNNNTASTMQGDCVAAVGSFLNDAGDNDAIQSE